MRRSAPIAFQFARPQDSERNEREQHEDRDNCEGPTPGHARHATGEIERQADGERSNEAARVAQRRVHGERGAASRRIGGAGRARGERRRIEPIML